MGLSCAGMWAVTAELIYNEGSFRGDLALVIDGDRISAVVDARNLPEDIDVTDWGHVAVLPGTVNAHGHAFQSLLKGFADDRTFESWRDDVLYPFSERLDGDALYAGALFAFSEALLAGTTTTVDFFYLHDDGNENAERVIRAARDVGVRLVLARCFYDEDAPTKAPSRYREEAADAARRCRELAEEHADDPYVHVQPAPHSLHAASPDTVRSALELARELGCPCHLHVAEARHEREQIEERYGLPPVKLLSREGLLDERLIAIHSVWLDDEELDLLAASRAGVVHCPGANAFLGDGIARVPEMLRRGIRVALGPDGGCANNRQSVFDEMRTATLVAKARLLDGGALDAATALRLGTEAGAELLGLPAGAIEPGRFADLVALDLDDLSLQPPRNLEQQVVNSMQATAIAKVMVGGEVVVEDGTLLRLDLAEVRRRVADATEGWIRP
jgi:5-methylthioadenosine/S-adenosylhomocysteine deaminase